MAAKSLLWVPNAFHENWAEEKNTEAKMKHYVSIFYELKVMKGNARK